MNEKKNILLHLYGDPDAEGDLRSLLKDPSLLEEHKALSEAKFRLDHMRRSRPDEAIVNRILAEAAQTGLKRAPGRLMGDRPAVRRFRSLRRVLIPAISIAAAVVISIGFGWFSFLTDDAGMNMDEVAKREEPVVPESLLRATPVDPDLLAPRPASSTDPLLAWDEAATIRDLYRRMETMRPTSPLDWGEGSVPLEMLPGSNQPGSPALRQVGAQRQKNPF